MAGSGDPRGGSRPGAPPGQLPPGIYWRRRLAVLAAGLAVTALPAFALSGALQPGPARSAPAGHDHRQGRAGPRPAPGSRGPDGRGGAGRHGPGKPGSGAAGGGGGTGRGARRARGRGSAGRAAPNGTSQSRSASAQPIRPAFCSWRAIELRVAAAGRFGPGRAATFSVSVVSGQRATCSFNLGSRHLALVIDEGPARIWSSADCPRGAATLITALRQGAPTALEVTWDRRTSAPGCPARTVPVPPGSYTARAVDGPLASPAVTFRLG